MTESQRKWLLDLQSKGVKLEGLDIQYDCWRAVRKGGFDPYLDYQIPAQSIPDIPDWRELCWEMQSKGVQFEMVFYLDRELVINPGGYSDAPRWRRYHNGFSFTDAHISCFRIPQQSLPEWREEMEEEMEEETKPDPREEIPHLEQQIQWYEDMLHHLRTGEPMREYEFRSVNEDGDAASEWKLLSNRHPSWANTHEYRRKPRTVKYWHCVGGYVDSGGKKDTVYFASGDRNDVLSETERYKARYPLAKFSPIIETTVEIE